MFSTKTGAASLSILSNSCLIALKLVVGVLTGSVSVIAEAVHSLLDLVAAIIAFFGIRMADQPPDEQHPFGHGKVENLSAVAEAGLILVAAGFVIYEAVNRLRTGARVELVEVGMAVMLVSVVVNIVVSRRLYRVARATDSVALEADARHLTVDIYTSAGVFLGLLAVRLTGLFILDPIIALGVAVIILKAAYDVTRKSFGGLLDEKLPPAEEGLVKASIMEHFGELLGFHELRTRKSGSMRYIDLHLVMVTGASLEEAHRLCDHLEADIMSKLPNASVTIHCEPASENEHAGGGS
ncbi:MAG: cation diffusion facilitator family transporter [Dehalococcoidia bacterium]